MSEPQATERTADSDPTPGAGVDSEATGAVEPAGSSTSRPRWQVRLWRAGQVFFGLVVGLVVTELAFWWRADGAFPHVNVYVPDAALGVRHVSLGDTTGMATPRLVEESLAAIRTRFPDLEVALHFHNTRGIGLANVLAGLDLGIREFESSIGGIGGCPFAPGATGNICTEDLVYLLHECGFETGLDLERLIGVARRVEKVVGHALPGQVMRAGPRLRRHSVEGTRRAVG